jgi:hypothetical protein
MRRYFGILILLLALPATAQDKEFEKNLRQRLERQWFLVSMNVADGLEYDHTGKPIKAIKPENVVDWTERQCHVDHVKLSAESLNVDCEFFAAAYGEAEQEFHPVRVNAYHGSWPRWGTLKIKRDPGDKDVDVLHALDAILVTTPDRFLSELPSYWKPFFSLPKGMRNDYLSKIAEQTKADADAIRAKGKLVPATTPGWTENFAGVVPRVRLWYKWGGRSLNLTEDRKGAIYFVVDEQGNAKDYQVVRPIGMRMEQWVEDQFVKVKYKPALLDGKPVAMPVLLNYSIGYR